MSLKYIEVEKQVDNESTDSLNGTLQTWVINTAHIPLAKNTEQKDARIFWYIWFST